MREPQEYQYGVSNLRGEDGAFAMPLDRLRRPRVWNGVCISRTR